MQQAPARFPQRRVGKTQGVLTADGRHEQLRPHQGQGPGTLLIGGFEHLRRQHDAAGVGPQNRLQRRVIGGAVAARPFEHHIDRHRRGTAVQQPGRHLAVGGPRPGQGADAAGPVGDLTVLLEPAALLQGGVIHRHHQHPARRTPGPPQHQQLILQRPFPHPPTGTGPAGRAPTPGHHQRTQDQQGQGPPANPGSRNRHGGPNPRLDSRNGLGIWNTVEPSPAVLVPNGSGLAISLRLGESPRRA